MVVLLRTENDRVVGRLRRFCNQAHVSNRKVFTLQTVPATESEGNSQVAQKSGFSLHAGVVAQHWERKKLERLCRYITRPAISEQRLSITPAGNVRYQLKTP
ncbi:MAG: transposase, partial [Gammaproteobacteria bacterium]